MVSSVACFACHDSCRQCWCSVSCVFVYALVTALSVFRTSREAVYLLSCLPGSFSTFLCIWLRFRVQNSILGGEPMATWAYAVLFLPPTASSCVCAVSSPDTAVQWAGLGVSQTKTYLVGLPFSQVWCGSSYSYLGAGKIGAEHKAGLGGQCSMVCVPVDWQRTTSSDLLSLCRCLTTKVCDGRFGLLGGIWVGKNTSLGRLLLPLWARQLDFHTQNDCDPITLTMHNQPEKH